MKDFLHHLLFPRESNNHRSKLLHHDSLLILICLVLFCTSLSAVVHQNFPQVLGISTNISPVDLLSFTNQKRQENGLPPLKMNAQLTGAATEKAHHMFAHNYWAHIAPDGTTPWYFIKTAGYEYLYAGENLARGFTTASDVVDAWMKSPSHRENMLSKNYNEVGFAIETGNLTGSETVLVVETLGTRYTAQEDIKEITAVVPQVTVVPSPSIVLSPSPTPTTQPIEVHEPTAGVAAIQNQPLVDVKSVSRDFSLVLLFVLLAVLVVDAIIIERKQVARVVAHNVDHIIFLTIVILVAIIIGRGAIL